MTVSTTVSRKSYDGAGTTGPFATEFNFINDSDLVVYKELISTGALTLLVLTADYTVTGAGDDAGGSVTTTAVVAATHRLIILLDPALTQLTDYQQNDPFPAVSHERALDKLTMIVKRLQDKLTRSIKAPESHTTDLLFGAADWLARASRVVGFDSGKNLTLFTVTQLAAIFNSTSTTWYSNLFSGDGATVNPVFALTAAPASAASVFVSIGGVAQRPATDFTVAGANLTIIGTVPLGVNNVSVQWGEAVAGAMTLADGSVTTPKLAAGVLSADAAGLAKMAAGYLQATATGLAKMAAGYFTITAEGLAKFVDGFWTATTEARAKFADGIWTFAKIDPAAIASQAESEAGTSALKLMTPQRTKQAIDVLAAGVNKGLMQVRGADCKNNAALPNTQFDLDADNIMLRSAADLIVIRNNPGAAITCNTATAGPAANGRDQAGAFAAGWVHFYWIWNPTASALATIASNVAPPTGPTLPADYTYWAYAGAVYYDGAALRNVLIKGSRVFYRAGQSALANGASLAEVAVNLATFIPPNALDAMLDVNARASNDTVAQVFDAKLSVVTANRYAGIILQNDVATDICRGSSFIKIPNVGQSVLYDWDTTPGGGANTLELDIAVCGYKIPNGSE